MSVQLSTDSPGNPLQEFKGTLKGIRQEEYTSQGENAKTRLRVHFDFIDVEVIKSLEPYPFPITTISVGYADPKASNSETNRWAHLSKTLRKGTQGACQPSEVLDFIVGKSQVWALATLPLRLPDDDGNWADRDTECWTLKSIDGVDQDSDEDIMGYLADLADGKDDAGFNEALFKDTKVKTHPKIIESATDRSLLPALEAAKLVTRDDDGVWHKV